MAVSSNLYPQMVEQRYNASMGRPMRLLKPVRVSVLESQVPTLLFTRSLLLEILLSHHVQFSVRWQLCSRWRLLSRLFPDCISGPLVRRSAVSRAMSVERRHTAHDQRRRCHHYKKPHRFEFLCHALAPSSLLCYFSISAFASQLQAQHPRSDSTVWSDCEQTDIHLVKFEGILFSAVAAGY